MDVMMCEVYVVVLGDMVCKVKVLLLVLLVVMVVGCLMFVELL